MPATAAAAAPAASPFGAAKERAAAKSVLGGPFLTKDEKAAIYVAGNPFWLVHAVPFEDKNYGSRARFIVTLDPATCPNGEFTADGTRTLDFAASPMRDALIEEIQPLLAAQKIIGPLYLDKVPAVKGEAWDIVDKVPENRIPY